MEFNTSKINYWKLSNPYYTQYWEKDHRNYKAPMKIYPITRA